MPDVAISMLHSMSKSKIQPLIALVSCRSQVIKFLLLRHRIPLAVTTAIARDIVHLCQAVDGDVGDKNSEQNLVATLIARGIVYEGVRE